MPVIQNISVPAGDDIEVTFNLDDDTAIDLNGAVIKWAVYDQTYGIPEGTPVLSKSTDGVDEIDVPGSPSDIFVVKLTGDDTKGMLQNYYHEAYVEDVNGNKNTITTGVFTVTVTKIASAQ